MKKLEAKPCRDATLQTLSIVCASYSFSPVRLVTPFPFWTNRSSGVRRKNSVTSTRSFMK